VKLFKIINSRSFEEHELQVERKTLDYLRKGEPPTAVSPFDYHQLIVNYLFFDAPLDPCAGDLQRLHERNENKNTFALAFLLGGAYSAYLGSPLACSTSLDSQTEASSEESH